MPTGPRTDRLGVDDQVVLHDLIDTPTIVRALRYASDGSVRSLEWEPGARRVVGLVQGSARQPYQASMTVTRAPDGRLVDLDGECTCPVGYNCKHALALLLAPAPRPGGPGRPALRVLPEPVTPDWERALRAALAGDEGAGGWEEPIGEIGVQFELLASRPVPGRVRQAGGPGIRIRPVSRSPSGNWVRSAVSWSRLEYLGYGVRPGSDAAVRLGLLKELKALAALGGRHWSAHGEEPVWLEEIPSRRVWDLLRHAEQLGIPLLGAGRDQAPVTIEPSPAEALIDVTETGTGLRMVPELRVGEHAVTLDSALLIGAPPHGVAWWGPGALRASTPALHLVPLSGPLPEGLGALLRLGPIQVPTEDRPRFEGELYPQLRRIVAFRSADGSVALPEVAPDVVHLGLEHGEGPSVALRWGLRSGTGPLRPLAGGPDREAAATLAAAVDLLVPVPGATRAGPAGLSLEEHAVVTGMAAARFMTDVVPRLRQLPGLVVESAGEARDFRESQAAPVVRLRGEESAGGDWFDLGVEVEVEGEEVPFQDLFVALAEGRTHLLLPSGTYFSLDREELRRLADLIAEARSLHDAPPGAVRLSRFQASLWEDLESLAATAPLAGAWADSVRSLLAGGGLVDHAVPDGLQATLRPYQLDGFRWLASLHAHRLGGILADDMGLGKTLQVLALVLHARSGDPAGPPWLVVAPTSVVGNWVSEAGRFAPGLRTVAISATERRRGAALADTVAGADVVVTSYALFRLEHQHYEAHGWAGLILDEAQFAKNPSSHAYQRARRLPVPFKLAVTGTPLENSLQELWALTSIVAPGLFARQDRFAEVYRIPIEKHRDTDRLAQLRRRLRPLMLRRTKSQVARDLPDKQEQVLELELHPRHRKVYDTYLQRERQKILGLIGDMRGNRFEIFRSLTLLRQACLDVALVDPNRTAASPTAPSVKLEALVEMLEDVVADGHRVLVFSQFTRYLTMARDRAAAAGIDSCYLDGSTTRRAAVIEGFRSGRAPVFFVSLKAGGFGLNLAEADYCVLLDPWWNPAAEAQAVDRAHRIGQTRKVMVYRMVAKDTIEEKVMALKARKAALFASVVDGGGFESAALSADDVRELLG